MQQCNESILSAYLDDELSPAEADAVQKHLQECEHCVVQLEAAREASQFMRQVRFQELTDAELSRIHAAIPEPEESTNFRLYASIGLIAASVLIVCATWLAALPEPRQSVATSGQPTEEWEQVATNLRVDPLSAEIEPMRFADARMTDWMVDSLTRKQP